MMRHGALSEKISYAPDVLDFTAVPNHLALGAECSPSSTLMMSFYDLRLVSLFRCTPTAHLSVVAHTQLYPSAMKLPSLYESNGRTRCSVNAYGVLR